MTVNLEKELRENKLFIINVLSEQMVAMKFNEYKDFQIEDDKPIAYLDATIEILKKAVKNAKLGQAKQIKFDKLEADRANLTPEELKQLEADQERNNDIVDSFLATLEPRSSLKCNLQAPGAIPLRYRGNVGSKFAKDHPFGVLI